MDLEPKNVPDLEKNVLSRRSLFDPEVDLRDPLSLSSILLLDLTTRIVVLDRARRECSLSRSLSTS